MKKIKIFTIIALTTLGLSTVSTIPADAATWHKGFPKTLKGTWTRKYRVKQGKKFRLTTKKIVITGHYMLDDINNSIGPTLYIHKAHYRKVSKNTYQFKATLTNANMSNYDRPSALTITKNGKHLKYKYATPNHHKYSGWFTKK